MINVQRRLIIEKHRKHDDISYEELKKLYCERIRQFIISTTNSQQDLAKLKELCKLAQYKKFFVQRYSQKLYNMYILR